MTACESINTLCTSVAGISKALVITVDPNGTRKYFRPTEDTNDARTVALGLAINAVAPGGKVVLTAGSFILSQTLEGYSHVHKNWKLQFEQGAWLAYTNENLAAGSDFAYEGTTRYALQHGIIPTPVGGVDVLTPDVMRSRIMAALFSMPASGDPIESVPEYPSFATRCGELQMHQAGHYINKPIYMTSFQRLIGVDGRATQIHPAAGFAPSAATEVFCIHFVRAKIDLGSGPISASNFSFDFRIENVAIQNFDQTNLGASGILFGGAQGSRIDGVHISGMGKRGIVAHESSNYFHLGRLFLDGTPLQTGPHLEINYCGNFELGEMELQLLNNNPTAPIKQYTMANGQATDLMGLAMYACSDFNIEKINGEQMRCLARLVDCENFIIGPIACGLNNYYQPPGGPPPPALIPVGGTMFSMRGGRFYTIGGFSGVGYERLYRLTESSSDIYLDEAFVAVGGGGLARHGQINSLLKVPEFLSAHGIDMPVPYEVSPPGSTDLGKWRILSGGNSSQFAFFINSYSIAGVVYNHASFARPGELGGQWPAGFTISLDTEAAGGVTIGKKLNVGWLGGLPISNPEIRVNNIKVIGEQQPAIANSADATTNAILAALRAHGIIAT